MASITWTDVTDIAPELTADNGVNIEAQNMILALVNERMNATEWGGESDPMLKLARIYLAAHFGTITMNQSAGAGPVVAEAAGGLSRSYAMPAPSDPLLGSTAWGKAYRSLLKASGIGAPVVC
jgi:hypothetical protein